MVLTERLDSESFPGLLRLLMTLGVAMLCATGMRFADASDLASATSAASSTEVSIAPREGGRDERMGLRSSASLGTSRSAVRPHSAGKPSPSAVSEPPRLRLQRNLAPAMTSARSPMRQGLSGGELNREGIVPARRILIRDGTIVLESDGKSQEEAHAHSPAALPNDFVSAEARTLR